MRPNFKDEDTATKGANASNKSEQFKGRKPNGKKTNFSNGKYGRTNHNDPAFYRISDNINSAISNIPFNRFPGMQEVACGSLPAGLTSVTSYLNNMPNATPGVLSLYYILSHGSSGLGSSSGVSAANTAAKALYTWVRHQNSGHANYESSDLMIYIMAMDEIYTYYLELKRVLTTVQRYELVNRNVPDVLLASMGVNEADLRANLAIYRGQLNLLAAQISSMAVPNLFTIFKRHAAVASVILSDSESRMSQMYLYNLAGVRQYDPAYNTEGGGLRMIAIPGPENFSAKLARLQSMIDAVISDEDMNIMSGDILKAYGRENLYTIAECDATETVAIVFDENMLQQIENSRAVEMDITTTDVYQQSNNIVEDYAISLNANVQAVADYIAASGAQYFNSHKEEVTPDDCMEYSRCMLGVSYDPNTKTAHYHPGSEFIINYALYAYHYTLGGVQSLNVFGFNTAFNRSGTQHPELFYELDKFDWHPMLYAYLNTTSSPTTVSMEGIMGDLKKYTLVQSETITAMNEVALMAELGSLVISQFRAR